MLTRFTRRQLSPAQLVVVLVAGLVLFLPGQVRAQQSLFDRVGPGFTGIAKGSSSVGDVNNDGNLDIVIAGDSDADPDQTTRTIAVYLGDGKGGFSKADADLFLGCCGDLTSTSLGDVNNDDNLDLLIAGGSTAALFLGDGEGGFTETDAGLTEVDKASTAIADMNGDGNADLVITGSGVVDGSNEILTLLYLGDGQGGFTKADAGLTGVDTGSVSIGDVNNDDHPDLLITGRTESGHDPNLESKLYLGDEQAQFTEANAGLTDVQNSASSIGDVDGDGNLDLFITGETESLETTATLYLGDGRGGFVEAGAGLSSVLSGGSAFGDVDADGNLDLIIAGNSAGTFDDAQPKATVFLGDGQGGFADTNAGLTGVVNASVSVGDIDKDQNLDLVITGRDKDDAASMRVYRGDGTAAFTTLSPDFAGVGVRSSTSAADVNGDGNLDLLITGRTQDKTVSNLYLGDGKRGFTKADAGLVGGEASAFGDVDNDGHIDLLINSTLYLGNGSGEFTKADAGLNGVSFGASTSMGDVDNDGNLDLLLTGNGEDGETATVYLGDGQGDFSKANAGLTGVERSASTMGDVNNDGNLDLIIAGSIDSEVSTNLYLGDGKGGFTKTTAGLVDVGFGPSISTADVDEDGNLDILITGESSDFFPETAALYLGDGNGGFTESQADLEGVQNGSSSSIGDVDHDGHLDLVLTGRSDSDPTATLYLGDGTVGSSSNGFSEPSAMLNGVEGSSSVLGDVDNDGHLDLLITGSKKLDGQDKSSILYENQSQGSLLAASASQSVGSDGTVDFNGTGVDIFFSGVSGSGEVTVQKFNDDPRSAQGIAKSNVSDFRYLIGASGGLEVGASTEIRFDVNSLSGVSNAGNVAIYKRAVEGTGRFAKLETTFDSGNNELVATTGSFSEFALASDSEPLPVEMAGFRARLEEEKVQLSWQTVSETNNASFRVQRKFARVGGGKSAWTTVGSVEGSGTTSQAQSYHFTDDDLPYEADALTYRLRQVDTDGSTHYSKYITVRRGVQELRLEAPYPNPAGSQLSVRYAVPDRQEVTIRLYDVLGRHLRTLVQEAKEGRHEQTLELSGISSGVYFLRLAAGKEVRTRRVTIVR